MEHCCLNSVLTLVRFGYWCADVTIVVNAVAADGVLDELTQACVV